MKQSLISLIVLIIISTTLLAQDKNQVEKKKIEEVTFIVGMHCQSCKERIEKIIPMEKGVKDIDVNLEKKEVTIFYNPKKTDAGKLGQAIKELGYDCKVKPSSPESGIKNTSLK